MLPTMKIFLIFIVNTLLGKSLTHGRIEYPQCSSVVIPVTVTASNVVLPVATPPVFHQVSGSYNIAARYCEPENMVESRESTLQVLVHGITYTRNYWSGDGNPGPVGAPGTSYAGSLYSWIDYASDNQARL